MLLLPDLLHVSQPFGVQQQQRVSGLEGVRHAPHPDSFGVSLHAGAQGETCVGDEAQRRRIPKAGAHGVSDAHPSPSLTRPPPGQPVHQVGFAAAVQPGDGHHHHGLRDVGQHLQGVLPHRQPLPCVVLDEAHGLLHLHHRRCGCQGCHHSLQWERRDFVTGRRQPCSDSPRSVSPSKAFLAPLHSSLPSPFAPSWAAHCKDNHDLSPLPTRSPTALQHRAVWLPHTSTSPPPVQRAVGESE